MFRRHVKTALALVVLASAGLARPCVAADFSSSGDGLVTLQNSLQLLERQLVSVKLDLTQEFETLAALEVRIRNRDGLDSIARELQMVTARIEGLETQVNGFFVRADTIQAKLAKIHDLAVRQRDMQKARAAQRIMDGVAKFQSSAKIVMDNVHFARDTVDRLWDLLG